MKTVYAIKHNNGSYFRGMTGIGPAFGATLENAELFDSREQAFSVLVRGGWKFFEAEVAEVVEVEEEPVARESAEEKPR